jgi:sigma-B regulation protein RsbU (phosphoserine phosphatase)
MNQILHLESVASMFVTIFYGILDLDNGEVVYCNGGHLPPCKIGKDGTVIAIETTGNLALGIMGNTVYKTKNIRLEPGDGLFLYTDGITEAMDADSLEYGEERLMNSLQQPMKGAKNLTQSVISAVKTFSAGLAQSDDMTVLALYYH